MEPFKVIIDSVTGERTEVPLTKEEIARAKRENELHAARIAELEVKAAAKQAVLDKLGLTAEEVAALLG